MVEAVTRTFSSSNSLIEDLKKKIKVVEKELATIASTIKDLSVSFPFIGQKRKRKKTIVTTTSIHGRITKRSHLDSFDTCSYAFSTSTIII